MAMLDARQKGGVQPSTEEILRFFADYLVCMRWQHPLRNRYGHRMTSPLFAEKEQDWRFMRPKCKSRYLPSRSFCSDCLSSSFLLFFSSSSLP